MVEDVSILHEIDDALRADKAMRFWKAYGKWVIGACAAIVAITAAKVAWNNHEDEVNKQQTHVLIQANELAQHDKFVEAAQMLESNTGWTAQQKPLMQLITARLYEKAGNKDKAKALLTLLSSAEPSIRDSAALRLHAMTGEPLPASAEGEGGVFALHAKEIKAAELLNEGKKKEAYEELQAILVSAPAYAPERQRAQELLRQAEEGK